MLSVYTLYPVHETGVNDVARNALVQNPGNFSIPKWGSHGKKGVAWKTFSHRLDVDE